MNVCAFLRYSVSSLISLQFNTSGNNKQIILSVSQAVSYGMKFVNSFASTSQQKHHGQHGTEGTMLAESAIWV